MSEASFLAADLESIFICEEIHENKAKRIAAELRRLAAVEQEFEALKRAISEAEPSAWLYELQFNGEWLTEAADIFDPRLHAEDQETFRNIVPLYTLNGIKNAG